MNTALTSYIPFQSSGTGNLAVMPGAARDKGLWAHAVLRHRASPIRGKELRGAAVWRDAAPRRFGVLHISRLFDGHVCGVARRAAEG